MHFQGQSGIEAREGEHGSQITKCLTARVRQSDLGRYSRLVSALWLFRSLNAQIENALGLDSGICSFWDSIQNPRNWLLTSGSMIRVHHGSSIKSTTYERSAM